MYTLNYVVANFIFANEIELHFTVQPGNWVAIFSFFSFVTLIGLRLSGKWFNLSISFKSGWHESRSEKLNERKKQSQALPMYGHAMWSDTSQKTKPWISTLSSLPIPTGWPDRLQITLEAERKKENQNRALPCCGLILESKMGFNPFITLSLARQPRSRQLRKKEKKSKLSNTPDCFQKLKWGSTLSLLSSPTGTRSYGKRKETKTKKINKQTNKEPQTLPLWEGLLMLEIQMVLNPFTTLFSNLGTRPFGTGYSQILYEKKKRKA